LQRDICNLKGARGFEKMCGRFLTDLPSISLTLQHAGP